MAKHIKNVKNIDKFLGNQIESWLSKTGVQLRELLKEFIYSEYYDQYEPSEWYERQYRIIDAIMVTSVQKIGNTYKLSIYLDPSLVSYDPSVWYHRDIKKWLPKQGDPSDVVFEKMSQGIHGNEDFGVTEGRFWEAFVEDVSHGGTHDLFESFKKSLQGKGILTIT